MWIQAATSRECVISGQKCKAEDTHKKCPRWSPVQEVQGGRNVFFTVFSFTII